MDKIIKRSIIFTSIMIVIVIISIVLINLNKKDAKPNDNDPEIKEAEKIKVENIQVEERTYMYLYSNDVLGQVFDYISQKEKNTPNAEALINLSSLLIDHSSKPRIELCFRPLNMSLISS